MMKINIQYSRLSAIQLMNVSQVSELLKIHPKTVLEISVAGEILKPNKLSSKVTRWRLSDLRSFIQQEAAV